MNIKKVERDKDNEEDKLGEEEQNSKYSIVKEGPIGSDIKYVKQFSKSEVIFYDPSNYDGQENKNRGRIRVFDAYSAEYNEEFVFSLPTKEVISDADITEDK